MMRETDPEKKNASYGVKVAEASTRSDSRDPAEAALAVLDELSL